MKSKLLLRIFSSIRKKDFITISVFSVLFGCAYSFGLILAGSETTSGAALRLLLAALLMLLLLTVLLWLSQQKPKNIPAAQPQEIKRIAVCIFFVLLASYCIPFCIYYPGVGNNDGISIFYYGMSASNQFPVFYCLYMQLLKQIGTCAGSLEYSIALYSVIQIFLVSLLSCRLILWVWKKQIPCAVKWMVLLYFVLHPLVCIYAIEMYKDPVFSLCLAGLCMDLWDTLHQSKGCDRSQRVWLLVDFAGVMLLRNNGKYVIAALLLILFLFERKKESCAAFLRRGVVLFLAFSMLSSTVTSWFTSEQLFQEKVAIPLQQICAVIVNDGEISEEDLKFMSCLMPIEQIKENYQPTQVNTIKWAQNFNRTYLNEHKLAFMKLWLSVGCRNFKIYLKAWLQETLTYWAPIRIVQESSRDCSFTIWNMNDNYWLYDYMGKNGVKAYSLLPEGITSLLDGYYQLALFVLYHGLRFWLILGFGILSLLKSRNGLHPILFYLPVLLLWGTIIISAPNAFGVRYGLIFVYMLPIYFAELFCNPAKEEMRQS